MIYILQHPDKGFSAYFHGVQFHKGIGSTSSVLDVQFLVKQAGCKAMSLDAWDKKKTGSKKKDKAEKEADSKKKGKAGKQAGTKKKDEAEKK